MAGLARASAVDVNLRRGLESGNVAPEHILEPAIDLHSTTARSGKHVGDEIIAGMVGCLFGRDARAAVVLRARSGEVPTAKRIVVFLLPMIGKRTSAGLAA